MSKESYQPSEEEIKKAEEMMTEEQKNRSVEREETIKAASVKIEEKNLKTKNEKDIFRQHDSEIEVERIEKLVKKIESMNLKLDGSEKIKIRFLNYNNFDDPDFKNPKGGFRDGQPDIHGYVGPSRVREFLNNDEADLYVVRYSNRSVTAYGKKEDIESGGAFRWEDIDDIEKVES